MTFSPEWETTYRANRYPIIGMEQQLMLLFDWFTQGARDVLEFGFSNGMNIGYWLARGVRYRGIEGSRTAYQGAMERFPQVMGDLMCGDFTQPMDAGGHDVVFDRASIAHNDDAGVERAIGNVWQALRPGGVFIGSDWFSARNSEASRADRPDGQFAGVGTVNFFDRDKLNRLFKDFDGVFLQERLTIRPKPDHGLLRAAPPLRWHSRAFDETDYVSAVWDIVVSKLL